MSKINETGSVVEYTANPLGFSVVSEAGDVKYQFFGDLLGYQLSRLDKSDPFDIFGKYFKEWGRPRDFPDSPYAIVAEGLTHIRNAGIAIPNSTLKLDSGLVLACQASADELKFVEVAEMRGYPTKDVKGFGGHFQEVCDGTNEAMGITDEYAKYVDHVIMLAEAKAAEFEVSRFPFSTEPGQKVFLYKDMGDNNIAHGHQHSKLSTSFLSSIPTINPGDGRHRGIGKMLLKDL